MATFPEYRYHGARVLVELQERHLREFLEVWRRAYAAGVVLPISEDPNYASLEHLLHHVLRAARGYLTWCCQVLELPDPGVEPTPAPDQVVVRAEAHLEHLLERWRAPLAGVEEERFDTVRPSRWGVEFAVESMLEHAVLHPMRHTLQLERLIATRPL